MASTIQDVINSVSTSVAVKAPCKVATTANITLSGQQTIDGVAVVTGDRVLVRSQTDSVDNGIWEVSTSSWTRTDDFDGNRDVVKGTIIIVNSGTVNGNKAFSVVTSDPIVIGTTAITFQQSPTIGGNASAVSADTAVVNTSTTVQSIIDAYETINILAEGANAGGATSNSTLFGTLTASGYQDRIIEVPHGQYAVNSDITMATCQEIRGLSTGGSHTDTSNGSIIRAISGGTFTTAMINMSGHSKLYGLKLDGNSIAQHAINTGDSSTGFKNVIENCRFGGCTRDAIIGTTPDSLTITRCEFNDGATSYGMIALTSASITVIDQCRFVPGANCAYMIKVTSALNNSRISIIDNLFEGSNAGADVSDFIDGIYVDADDVRIEGNIFQMSPSSTVHQSHIRIKSGAARTYIGKNVFQNTGGSAMKIIIESGATDTVIDCSAFGWTSGAGVASDITDNGTNTLLMFAGTTSGRRFFMTPAMTIAALNGGKQFHFDTATATLYFNEHSNTNNFIGAPSGTLVMNSNGALDLKVPTGSSIRAQVNSAVVAQFSDTTGANEMAMYLKVHGGTIQRVSVGAADSGGAGYRVLRIPN